MMKSPFDNEPDLELGRALRTVLTGPAPEAFLQRLKGAIAGVEQGSQWDILAAWSRPRVMIAAIAAAFLLWFGGWMATSLDLEPGVMVASLPAHTVLSPQPPPVDEILSALMERR
jgi:hypothetical protein